MGPCGSCDAAVGGGTFDPGHRCDAGPTRSISLVTLATLLILLQENNIANKAFLIDNIGFPLNCCTRVTGSMYAIRTNVQAQFLK